MKKKTISIYALPSHASKERTSGVDFARIIQPIEHLNGYQDDEVKFEARVFQYGDTDSWKDIVPQYDIIFLNYINDPWTFAYMGSVARKLGKKIVLDLDDALWNLLPDNTAFNVYKKGSEGIHNFTAICNEVDYMTTTNQFLKNVVMSNTNKSKEKIEILPNYVDLDKLYTHRSPFKNTGSIQLTHFGSTTHFIDLQGEQFEKGIDLVMKQYPNVTLKTIGSLIPKYKYKWGQRYSHDFGDVDIYKWVKNKFGGFMDETDILVTPLSESTYTKSKSNIKWLEGSSAIKPGVWQDIRQYNECVDGTNGLLARNAQDWFNQIKILIDDVKFREETANNALKSVEKDWQMKKNVYKYANLFKKVLS